MDQLRPVFAVRGHGGERRLRRKQGTADELQREVAANAKAGAVLHYNRQSMWSLPQTRVKFQTPTYQFSLVASL